MSGNLLHLLTTNYPDIDWKGAMGFRDVIAHQYFDLDREQVLLICQEEGENEDDATPRGPSNSQKHTFCCTLSSRFAWIITAALICSDRQGA